MPQTEDEFNIRVSDHSKIDGVHDDAIDIYGKEIMINIFSKSKKEEAITYLKNYFSKIKVLADSREVFTNKVEKKVLKTSYPEKVDAYLKKLKVDTSKTKKQVQAQALESFIKLKPTGKLTKKEYEKSRGLFRLKSTDVYEGIITSVSSTGGLATINRQTGKDYTVDKELHRALLLFATKGDYSTLERIL